VPLERVHADATRVSSRAHWRLRFGTQAVPPLFAAVVQILSRVPPNER